MNRLIPWLLLSACADPPYPEHIDVQGDPVQRVSVPLFGGAVAADDFWVAASDVDGDRIELRSEAGERHEVVLPSGWVPGPLLFGQDGILHVLLRGTGELLSVDPGEPWPKGRGPSLKERYPVCEAPRGLGLEPGSGRIWVACAGGELVGVGDGESRYLLDSDLRDVVPLADGRALVSRLRSAEVLVVDLSSGAIERRLEPVGLDMGEGPTAARVARRMIPWKDGALLVFQSQKETRIDAFRGYSDIVIDTVVEVDPEGISDSVGESLGLTIDLLPMGDGVLRMGPSRLVIDETWSTLDPLLGGQLGVDFSWWSTTALVTGAAVGPSGAPWVATREPFALLEAKPRDHVELANRGGGLTLFHRAPTGIACASCHPEGMDDGHVWDFEGVGPRRTQALGGGILDSAPFHWDGDMADMNVLYEEVGEGRMRQAPAWGDQVEQLAAWMDALPVAPSGPRPDEALVARGEALFHSAEVGCASCHVPPRYTAPGSFQVGTGGRFQVPSLRGVGARLPVMHDGCAQTLLDRFTDPECGGGDQHGKTSGLSQADIDALVAFLATL